MNKQINKQTGFTLIELVVVIVILGILAATAMPKFANLNTDARKASVKAVVGTLKSAAALAHAKQLVDGAASDVSVTLDGNATVEMLLGYPKKETAGIGNAVQLSAEITSNGTGTFTIATGCTVSYVDSVGGALPAVSSDMSGC